MKKLVSLFITVALLMSFGTCAFAYNEPNTGTISEVTSGTMLNTNEGLVTENNGTVNENNGTVTENSGMVTENNGTVTTNENYGMVNENNGTVENNEGNVFTNNNTVETNNDTVSDNNGTIIENNGYVSKNNTTGTVKTNNKIVAANYGTVDTNYGTVEYNKYGSSSSVIETNGETGVVKSNQTGCVVKRNYGTVEENNGIIFSSYEGATVKENNRKILFNGGTVKANNGSIESNTGTVTMTNEDAKVSVNYGTVENGKIVTNANDTESIVYGSDTIYAVVYYESEEIMSNAKNYVAGERCSAMTEDEAAAQNITRNGYKLTGWLDENSSEEYTFGQKFILTSPKIFQAIWSKLADDAQNYWDYIVAGDSNGKVEGKVFFFKHSIEKFENVSFAGKYLVKDVDYIVTEVEGGTQIEFTAEFFEKNTGDSLSVAPIFTGVIYSLYAVNE